jgi:hypothetical protein
LSGLGWDGAVGCAACPASKAPLAKRAHAVRPPLPSPAPGRYKIRMQGPGGGGGGEQEGGGRKAAGASGSQGVLVS